MTDNTHPDTDMYFVTADFPGVDGTTALEWGLTYKDALECLLNYDGWANASPKLTVIKVNLAAGTATDVSEDIARWLLADWKENDREGVLLDFVGKHLGAGAMQ